MEEDEDEEEWEGKVGVAEEEGGTCFARKLCVDLEGRRTSSSVTSASARMARIFRINWSVCRVPSMRDPTRDPTSRVSTNKISEERGSVMQ